MKKILLIGAAAILSLQTNAQEFDPTFDGNGWREDTVSAGLGQSYYDVLVQSDNKVVVSGLYDINNFIQDISVVRYNVNGSLDNSFGTGGKVYLNLDATGIHHSSLAKNAAGEIFVSGSQANADGPFYICKLTQSGSIDNSFGTNGIVKDSLLPTAAVGFEHANAIAVQADGKILVAGYYAQSVPNTEHAAWVIRYNTNGTRDNNFGTNGLAKVIGGDNSFGKLCIQPDGKILAGGCSGLIQQQQQDWMVARFNTDGTMDNTFGGNQDGVVKIGMQYHETVKGMDLQSDGSIIIGGSCGNGNVTFRIIKLTAAGLNDPNFGTNVTSSTNWGYTPVELQTFTDHYFADLSVLPDDKIIIGGTVSNFKFAAIRFKADGDPDNTFGTNSVADTQFVGGYGVGMRGAIFDEATGRFYVAGATADQNMGVTYSAVVAVNVAAPNSVKEIAGTKKLSIYPNPVNGTLHMESIEGNILVQDISGRTIISAQGKDIDVTALTNGMYFIKCITKDGNVYTGQFVKN